MFRSTKGRWVRCCISFNTLFSSNDELTQAQEALVGKGQYPAIYQDLAAGQVNVTPYDIAMAQLQKAEED